MSDETITGYMAVRHWVIRGNHFDNANEKLVYLVLADHTDDNGECYPSVATIAKESLLSRGTVFTCLNSLEEKGLIRRVARTADNGARQSNTYYLTLDEREIKPDTADKTVYQAPEQANTTEPAPEPEVSAEHVPAEEEYPAEFTAIWAVYPKHVAKKQALKAWKTARKKTNSAFLLARVQMFATQSAHTETKYIPNLATWLNGERWNDEYRPDPPKQRKPQTNAERNMQTLAASMNQTDIFGFEIEAPKPDYPEF